MNAILSLLAPQTGTRGGKSETATPAFGVGAGTSAADPQDAGPGFGLILTAVPAAQTLPAPKAAETVTTDGVDPTAALLGVVLLPVDPEWSADDLQSLVSLPALPGETLTGLAQMGGPILAVSGASFSPHQMPIAVIATEEGLVPPPALTPLTETGPAARTLPMDSPVLATAALAMPDTQQATPGSRMAPGLVAQGTTAPVAEWSPVQALPSLPQGATQPPVSAQIVTSQITLPAATQAALAAAGPVRVLTAPQPPARGATAPSTTLSAAVAGVPAIGAAEAAPAGSPPPDQSGAAQPSLAAQLWSDPAVSEAMAPSPMTAAAPGALTDPGTLTEPRDRITPAPLVVETARATSGPATPETDAPAPRGTPEPPRFAQAIAAQVRAAQVSDGHTRVALNPRGLGQIELDLKTDADGRMSIVVRVENPAVLTALRDDRALLAQAIGAPEGSQMDFQAQSDARRDAGQPDTGPARPDRAQATEDETQTAAPARPRAVIDRGQLDLTT